jgi:uncharacterized membrane protein required for colicin V production
VAIGYGCGFMFGVIIGYVVFKTRRPAWFLKMVEDQWSLMQAEQRRMLVEMVQEENKQCSQYLQSSFCKLFPFRFCKYRTISNHNYSYIL